MGMSKAEGGTIVDTKTLVVGQEVRVVVPQKFTLVHGKVVKVTPDGVEVLTESLQAIGRSEYIRINGVLVPNVADMVFGKLMTFDSNGKGKSGYEPYEFECAPVLDTQKLVVGQEVSMSSGVYGCEGEVVKVTPNGVEVQTNHAGFLRFDNKGKGLDWGTHECGPWYIDDMPFTAKKPL